MTASTIPEPLTDLDWLAAHAGALYVHDPNGRIEALNVPEGNAKPAPYFFFGRTRHGNLWRFRDTLPRDLVRELARLAGAEKTTEDLERDPERFAVMLERIRAEVPAEIIWRGPAFLRSLGLATHTKKWPEYETLYHSGQEGGWVHPSQDTESRAGSSRRGRRSELPESTG